MPNAWARRVCDSKQLALCPGPALRGGLWSVTFATCLSEFNALSRRHALGVTLVRSDTPLAARGEAQHLNPRYLEGRARKFTEADSFQLSCAVTIRGQPRIDKRVFRRNVGRREQVALGQPTVDYIRRHFELAWVILPRSEIAILERDLIARIAPTGPLYNLGGNPSPGRNLSNRRVAAGAEGR